MTCIVHSICKHLSSVKKLLDGLERSASVVVAHGCKLGMYGFEFEDTELEGYTPASCSKAFCYSGKQTMKLATYSDNQAIKLTTVGQVKLYNYISTRSLRVPASDCRNFKICVLFDVISPKPCTS